MDSTQCRNGNEFKGKRGRNLPENLDEQFSVQSDEWAASHAVPASPVLATARTRFKAVASWNHQALGMGCAGLGWARLMRVWLTLEFSLETWASAAEKGTREQQGPLAVAAWQPLTFSSAKVTAPGKHSPVLHSFPSLYGSDIATERQCQI